MDFVFLKIHILEQCLRVQFYKCLTYLLLKIKEGQNS